MRMIIAAIIGAVSLSAPVAIKHSETHYRAIAVKGEASAKTVKSLGYRMGYRDGYAVGKVDGYAEGYAAAKDEWWRKGWTAGYEQCLEDHPPQPEKEAPCCRRCGKGRK